MKLTKSRLTLIHRHRRRKLTSILTLFCVSIVCCLYAVTKLLLLNESRSSTDVQKALHIRRVKRNVLVGAEASEIQKNISSTVVKIPYIGKIECEDRTLLKHNHTLKDGVPDDVFPDDLFTLEQRRKGAILVHVGGLVYMFVALAIVCDEFFVPALNVVAEWLSLSDDVAGATFMAAGGSAPEFFTSLFGVFITENNVGVGTIVGSATFNILCVLAFCTLFSTTILELTWWPLFRDMFFYATALALLVVFFLDEKVQWSEALLMFLLYVAYGFFMKYNSRIETAVKKTLQRKKIGFEPNDGYTANLNNNSNNNNSATAANNNLSVSFTVSINGASKRHLSNSVNEALWQQRKSIPVLHSGAMFRMGIMGMVLDPNLLLNRENRNSLSRIQRGGSVDSNICRVPPKNRKLSKTISSPALRIIHNPSTSGVRSSTAKKLSACNESVSTENIYVRRPSSTLELCENEDSGSVVSANPTRRTSSAAYDGFSYNDSLATTAEMVSNKDWTKVIDESLQAPSSQIDRESPRECITPMPTAAVQPANTTSEAIIEQPIDLSFPPTFSKQCVYLIIAPIMFPLFYTLPDVKNPNRKKYALITFIGSILWIALFSYFMVWWANTIGTTLGIPTEVMGLTILAAGTSIPDLITSVIVSRKGLGDMAVSSSIGSNLFDICIGLPVPWLLYFCVNGIMDGALPRPISVQSDGLLCSLGMLFVMLTVLLIGIIATDWRMNHTFGILMIISYVAFCTLSILLEKKYIHCPLRVC